MVWHGLKLFLFANGLWFQYDVNFKHFKPDGRCLGQSITPGRRISGIKTQRETKWCRPGLVNLFFFLWRLRAGGFCLNHAHSMASMALCIIQTMAPHRQIMPDHCSACLVFLSWPQSNCASELLEVLRMDVDFQHCLRMGSHTKGVDWTLSAASLGVQHRLLFTFVHRLLRMRGHYCSWTYINCLLFTGMKSCTRDFFDTTYRVSTISHSFSTQLLPFVWSPLWHISWQFLTYLYSDILSDIYLSYLAYILTLYLTYVLTN